MNQETWKTIWEVSQRARRLPPHERAAYIREACPDPEALAEVEALLNEPSDVTSSRQTTSVPAPPLHLEVGHRIGRYTVTGLLGRGAMGDTFSGRDEELNRPVALKVLRSWPGETEAWQRSIREARSASALNHPNIVMVFEVLSTETGAAIVMELVEGRLLRHWCGQPRPVSEIAAIGRQAALGLAAAHAAGIVHRDVKPENIVVRSDGYVKLLDFGLARPAGSRISTGGGAGTLRYMSPEQARSEALTGASDIFSLGVVLFEMTTGSHPFEGASDLDVLVNVALGKLPDLAALNARMPAPYRALIGRMLDRDPAARPSASEVAAELGKMDGPQLPAATSHPQRRWLAWTLALLAVLAAGGASWWKFSGGPSPNSTKGLPRFTQFTRFTEDNYVTSAAISPDGERVIFMNVDGDIRIRDVHGEKDRLVTRLPNHHPEHMYWIADTGKVLLNSLDLAKDSYAFQVSILDPEDGGRKVLPVSGKRAKPSPDGRRMVYISPDRAEVWVSGIEAQTGPAGPPAEAGTRGQATPPGSVVWANPSKALGPRRLLVSNPGTVAWVEWSPNGRQIHLFSAAQALGATRQWRGVGWKTIDADTGSLLGEQPTERIWPGFMQSDGRLLMVRSGGGVVEVSFDERGRFRHEPREITPQTMTGWLTASASGHRISGVHFTWNRGVIHVADLEPGKARIGERRRLTVETTGQFAHAWTPDNKSVIFESASGPNGKYQINIQALDAKLPRVVSPSNEDQVLPMVSPDGRWVLFLSGSAGPNRQFHLKRAPLAGGAAEPVPTGGAVLDFGCMYRARCVLREIQQGQAVFYELDPIRGKGRELTRAAVNQSVFGDWSLSPDGSMVVFADPSRAPAVLRIIYLDKPPLEKSVPIEGPAPMGLAVWTAAGDGWYVPTQDYQLRLIDWDGRNRYVHDIGGFAIPSGDGKRLAFLDHQRDQNVWLLER